MLKKQHLFLTFATMFASSLFAQHQVSINGQIPDTLQLTEVVINASRADGKTPLTTSEMGRQQLEEIRIFAGNAQQTDDITILTAKLLEKTAEETE